MTQRASLREDALFVLCLCYDKLKKQAMATLPLKIVHASVRLARVAILIDKADTDWQHTCLRIIEIYSQLWGGAYNIIVPTDGNTIDEQFWTLLETFDPDHLYRYNKSLGDYAPRNENFVLVVFVKQRS